jgi:CcmD family protein
MTLLPSAIVFVAVMVSIQGLAEAGHGGESRGPALRTTETLQGPAKAGRYVQAQATPQQPSPQQQSEFVPVSELPPQDQLPAAPLLISAYVVVWIALFGYLFSVARRLGVVQRDVERLETDLKRAGRL